MSKHITSINGMGSITTEETSPGVFDSNTTGMRDEDHMHFSQDFVANAGVVKVDDYLAVEIPATMTVGVQAGVAYVLNDSYTENSVTETKFWRVISDGDGAGGDDVVTIDPNGEGLPRYTSIFLKVDDSAAPGDNGEGSASVVAVNGTPLASPAVAPQPSGNYLRVADVYVGAGVTSITSANITNVVPRVYLSNDSKHRCHLSKTAVQSIPNTTWTPVTFNTELYDIGGLHSTSTNTDRITVVRDGLYLFTATLAFDASSGDKLARYYVNGAGVNQGYMRVADTAFNSQYPAVAQLELSAGDYVTVNVYHNDGGALNILSAVNISCIQLV